MKTKKPALKTTFLVISLVILTFTSLYRNQSPVSCEEEDKIQYRFAILGDSQVGYEVWGRDKRH